MNQRLRRIFILLLLSVFIYYHLSLRKELHNAQGTIKQLQRTIEPLMKSLSRCHHHATSSNNHNATNEITKSLPTN